MPPTYPCAPSWRLSSCRRSASWPPCGRPSSSQPCGPGASRSWPPPSSWPLFSWQLSSSRALLRRVPSSRQQLSSAPPRAWPARPPARLVAAGAAAVLAAARLQIGRQRVHCEHGAVRIDELRDPVAARHFHRTVDERAARTLGLLDGVVHVLDANVAEPARAAGHLGRLVEHAAALYAVAAEEHVLAHLGAHVVLGHLLPTEDCRVEVDRCAPVAGGQLVPGEFAALRRRLLARVVGALIHGDRRTLRIRQHGVLAAVRDGGDFLRHAGATALGRLDRRLDVRRADVVQPVRRARRLRDRAAYRAAAGREHLVGGIVFKGLRFPADDLRVEGVCAARVRRHQLMPDKSSTNSVVCHHDLPRE